MIKKKTTWCSGAQSVLGSPHQDGDDAFELLFHQVTDDLVVEILDWLPLKNHTGTINISAMMVHTDTHLVIIASNVIYQRRPKKINRVL